MPTVSGLQYFPLVIFILVIIFVIGLAVKEVTIRIPLGKIPWIKNHVDSSKVLEWRPDFSYPPLIGVLVLGIGQAISWDTIDHGVVGDKYIQPYTIIILFMALAYISISVDLTGLFAYIAIRISNMAAGSSRRLFCYYFVLSSIMTIFTSNDIVILTLTPIIYYACLATKQDPVPYLVAEFFAANIWSITLFVGNPTNIIVAQAMDLGFLEYSRWLGFPAFVAGATTFVMLYVYFFLVTKRLLPSYPPCEINPAGVLKDQSGAIFGTIILLSCLACLSISPVLGAPLWVITVIFAGIFFLRNVYAYVIKPRRQATMTRLIDLDSVSSPHAVDSATGVPLTADTTQPGQSCESSSAIELAVLSGVSKEAGDDKPNENHMATAKNEQIDIAAEITKSLPKTITIWSAIHAMPWKVVPFTLGMFTLVESLSRAKWIDLMAVNAAEILHTTGDAVFFMLFASILAANLINNQPMTILFTRLLLNERFTVTSRLLKGSMFAVIVGSNIGANYTLIGALAGIMWVKLLRDKGVNMTYKEFSYYGLLLILPPTVLCGLSILALLA